VEKAANLKYETSVDLGWKDEFAKIKFIKMMMHQKPFAYDEPT